MYAKINACGYAYHLKPVRIQYREGLQTYLFRLQLEGNCQALVDGSMQTVEAGDLLLYQPCDPYELRIGDLDDIGPSTGLPSGDLFMICEGSWIDSWWHRKKRLQQQKLASPDPLITMWKLLASEKRRVKQGGEGRTELLEYGLRTICLLIDEVSEVGSRDHLPSFKPLRMKAYIEEHALDTFRVADVAGHVGLSVSRAVHLFKEYFGQTMVEYALEVRLSMAMDRLQHTSLTLEQIALTSGFGSYSYFHRIFRRKYGCSPDLYRRQALRG